MLLNTTKNPTFSLTQQFLDRSFPLTFTSFFGTGFIDGYNILTDQKQFLPTMTASITSPNVLQLARWMAADFSNQAQAWENPPFFAHIRVAMRPLPIELLNGISLFLEQAYDIALQEPYRMRVLKLVPRDGLIEIENYLIKDEANFYGAARQPAKLQELTIDRLQKLEGCSHLVEWKDNGFFGYVQPGKQCIVNRNGQDTYLASTFEIDADRFSSLDRGCDLETDAKVWGSIAGPFEFVRTASFADELPEL
jgi:CpeT/CpcT family (DUF1001)